MLSNRKIRVLQDEAKEIIDDYCWKEFGIGADFDDLSKIPIGFTTTLDEQYDIQLYVNLVNYTIDTYLDTVLVRTEKYDDLQDIICNGIDGLEFDLMIDISDKEISLVQGVTS